LVETKPHDEATRMCPLTTPGRSRAKHQTSAAPFTSSTALKGTGKRSTNGIFFRSSTNFKWDANSLHDHFSSATSRTTKGNSNRVVLTFPTMISILLTCSIFSFFIGCYVRHSRHLDYVALTLWSSDHPVSITSASIPKSTEDEVLDDSVPTSWSYDLQFDRRNADARYSFRNFVGTQLVDTVVTSNSVLLNPDGTLSHVAQKQPSEAKKEKCTTSYDTSGGESNNFEPSGQHILVDIDNVDISFLRSEERLTGAMIELIQTRTNMTLLSYHCHSHVHQNAMGGISCAGILLESHVSFHTFPMFGIISFDLFSCGKSSLVSVLSDVQELFAIPAALQINEINILSTDTYVEVDSLHGRNVTNRKTTTKLLLEPQQPPRVKWTYKRRGFRSNYNVHANVTKSVSVAEELPDLHWMLSMGNLEKTHVTTVQTDFQRIDIFDMKRFHTRPTEEVDRVVFLDGIIQSRFIGEQAYHEALVHPVMICHKLPKRVIIIGGGEGATLREVLKHNSVEEVIMVEIDEKMVLTSQMYLPEWSTCDKDISCFDDPRATTYFTDAIAWFIDRFGENSTIYDGNDVFDIIIMDALYVFPRKRFVSSTYHDSCSIFSFTATQTLLLNFQISFTRILI
jgi:S-adenosylmethionine/arginine decarboxylase-like enzyme